jgi:hypothetical protein
LGNLWCVGGIAGSVDASKEARRRVIDDKDALQPIVLMMLQLQGGWIAEAARCGDKAIAKDGGTVSW